METKEMQCVSEMFFTYWDAFMWGLMVGGIVVVIARFLEQWFNNKILLDQKRLDILLGKALLEMKKELDK